MKYYAEIRLRDGRTCILRHAEPTDAEAFLAYFQTAHGETDYLMTYPDEPMHTAEEMAEKFTAMRGSPTDMEICAFVDGMLVGSAGNRIVSNREKVRHRAEFGISILRDFWGLGIGNALTGASIDCARQAGLVQLELDVVADNTRAVALYEKYGFTEYGRNPLGFRTREGEWQELLYMRLVL